MLNSMLSNKLKELAAGYVLDDLNAQEILEVERLIEEKPELLQEIKQLQIVIGLMASNIPQMKPPADLLNKIMKAGFTN